MAKRIIKIMMVQGAKSHLRGKNEGRCDSREAHDARLVLHKKSAYKYNRNKVLEASSGLDTAEASLGPHRPAPLLGALLEPPTDRPHGSLTILLQLTMLWPSPNTLGFAAARRPTPEIPIRLQDVGGNPAPTAKMHTKTTHPQLHTRLT